MSWVVAADLNDKLLRERVSNDHLAEVDEWVKETAAGFGVAEASIPATLPRPAKRAAVCRLAIVVARSEAGQNQRSFSAEGSDVFLVKHKLYESDLKTLLPTLTAQDFGAPETEPETPAVSIPLWRG